MMARKSKVERLVDKLRAAGYAIPERYTFERFYPGYWQRRAEAWAWRLYGDNFEIGSPDSVTVLLKCNTFTSGRFNTVYGAVIQEAAKAGE